MLRLDGSQICDPSKMKRGPGREMVAASNAELLTSAKACW